MSAIADDTNIASLMVGAHNFAILRVNGMAEDDLPSFVPPHFQRNGDRFRQAGGAIIVTGVSGIHARQCAHHTLIFVGRLQGALRDFRLVGRIRGVEFASQQDMIDHRRDEMVISAGTAEQGVILPVIVHLADRQHLRRDFHFAHRRRQIQRRKAIRFRYRIKQAVD